MERQLTQRECIEEDYMRDMETLGDKAAEREQIEAATRHRMGQFFFTGAIGFGTRDPLEDE